jgi:two-component system cell cycle sensor histidine kinase/response regulator CckA
VGDRKQHPDAEQGEPVTHRMAQVMECSPDIIAILGRDLHIRYINRHPAEEDVPRAVGRHIRDTTHPSTLETAEQAIRSAFHSGEPVTYEAAGHDGTITYRCRVVPLKGDGGTIDEVVVVATDIADEIRLDNERRSLEAQLRQSQKMEAVGQLAGGVAHDFNNLLTVARVHAGFVKEAMAEGRDASSDLAVITEAINRGADLTRTLLDISREQPHRRLDVDAVDVLRQCHRMVRRLLPAGIVLDVELPGEPLWIHVDPSQLDQALLNLCVNAQHALGEVGRLRLRARWEEADDEVLIEVEDNGVGMDAATLERAMDPFFTTKEADTGTGLGLAMTRTLVTGNAGTIAMASETGVGTTVTLRFPRVIPAPRENTVGQPPLSEGRRGRLLLAEDEPMVRRATRRILERAGFDVVTANDGKEALSLFEEHADTLIGAVCDVVMPGGGGRQLWEAVQAAKPGFKVLFCSGYSADAMPPAFVKQHGLTILPKPYTRDEMLEALDAMGIGVADTPNADAA